MTLQSGETPQEPPPSREGQIKDAIGRYQKSLNQTLREKGGFNPDEPERRGLIPTLIIQPDIKIPMEIPDGLKRFLGNIFGSRDVGISSIRASKHEVLIDTVTVGTPKPVEQSRPVIIGEHGKGIHPTIEIGLATETPNIRLSTFSVANLLSGRYGGSRLENDMTLDPETLDAITSMITNPPKHVYHEAPVLNPDAEHPYPPPPGSNYPIKQHILLRQPS